MPTVLTIRPSVSPTLARSVSMSGGFPAPLLPSPQKLIQEVSISIHATQLDMALAQLCCRATGGVPEHVLAQQVRPLHECWQVRVHAGIKAPGAPKLGILPKVSANPPLQSQHFALVIDHLNLARECLIAFCAISAACAGKPPEASNVPRGKCCKAQECLVVLGAYSRQQLHKCCSIVCL